MKKLRLFLLAGLACMALTACEKDNDEETTGRVKTFGKFVMADTQLFRGEGKVVLDFDGANSKLLYENGDYVKINGEDFRLTKSGSGASTVWTANGTELTAKKFYCAYVDGVNTGVLSNFDEAGTYRFNLNTRLSQATNKILLGGVTDSNVLTLRPACAIIRLKANASYSDVKIGFEASKILKEGTMTINASEVTLSGSSYLAPVTDATGSTAELLSMEYNSEHSYWYVAVPVSGSVTTTLYLQWTVGGEIVRQKTSGQVTLTKGYVYDMGTERNSPFYANGSSKSYFKVSGSRQIRFSAGNLQYTRYEDPGTGEMTGKWRFAEHQYDMEQSGNENIDPYYEGWIDLFCWGTSGWNSGGGAAYEPYEISGTFKPGGINEADLLGEYANADWGVYNGSNIYYGTTPSGLSSWRTLTNDEWDYLLTGRPNAVNKYALATVGTAQGLVLLPESWSLPEGCSFSAGTTSGYSTNTYTLAQWDKMEMAGAIFLPSAGKRSLTDVSETPDAGYYWSANHYSSMQCYAMKFTSSSVSASVGTSRATGCAVRLVKNR